MTTVVASPAASAVWYHAVPTGELTRCGLRVANLEAYDDRARPHLSPCEGCWPTAGAERRTDPVRWQLARWDMIDNARPDVSPRTPER